MAGAGRIITKEASGTTIVAGIIKSINDDGTMTITTQESRRETKKDDQGNVMKNKDGQDIQRTVFSDLDVVIKSDLGFSAEEYKVGRAATAIGEYSKRQNHLVADAVLSNTPGMFTYPYKNGNGAEMELQVIAGFVRFANMNEEIDKTTGEHFKNQSGEPRKPHFDVCVSVKDEATGDYVSHIVKFYNSKNAAHQIDACKRIFADFDKEKNTAFVTLIVGPGRDYTRTRTTDKGEFTYKCSEHLGNNLPVAIIRERSKEQTKTNAQEAEQQSGDGFSQGAIEADDYDMNDFQ